MTCRPCLDTYIHTYKQTINQYKQIVIIHKSIQTYSYTYTWLQMVRPPQPTHRGGAGTLCVYVISLFAYTIKMTCRPCLDTYIHTYKQTINQYKQIVIIHKSIQTYSYTYTWLQMVRPPQPTHRGGGGNIMCTCSIFVCRHKNNDMSTLLGHVHTYIPTDRRTDTQAYIHKSIQTYSYTYTWLHMCDVSPLWGGGWGGTRGGWIIYISPDLDREVQCVLSGRVLRLWKECQTYFGFNQVTYLHSSTEALCFGLTISTGPRHTLEVPTLAALRSRFHGAWGGVLESMYIYI